MDINLIGTFDCIRLAATAMSQTEPLADGERGAIVTVASVAAFDGQIGQASYSASKGGVVGLTLPVARDLSVVGIGSTASRPGSSTRRSTARATPASSSRRGSSGDVLFPDRLGTAGEFASMAVELITNSYMNAEVIRVDGGVRTAEVTTAG